MTTSITSSTGSVNIGGLASGVQWRDLVDQLVAAETARSVTPIQTQISAAEKRKTAWNDLTALVTKLQDAGNALKLGSTFSNFTSSVSASSQTNRTLLSSSANAAARPGSYRVEVVDLARAEKLSGAVVADSAVALGLAGSFAVAGQNVTIEATDTLDGVRDKINALNTGASATKVSASILTSAAGQKRLVLSADAVGSNGTGLTDGSEGVLRDLGFLDTRSRAVPSSGLAVAAALGVTMPPPSSIRVGGRTISVDLTVDSISSIVAKIRAAGGQAEVQTETVGGVPSYRMSIGGNVTATADAGSADTIAALGLAAGAQASVQQVLASNLGFQDATNNVASGATLLTDLRSGGASLGVNVGDTLTFSGQRGDGTLVTTSFVVGGADTLATLVSKLNDSTSGFGGGSRPAQASIDGDGKLRLNDGTGGDSRLRLAVTLSPAAGGAPVSLLGNFDTETVGRSRAMVRGSDAQVRVDGVLLTRSSNTISDALDGVTLNLLQSEPGSEVDLTVTRDLEASVKGVKDFAKAYNDIVTFASGQQLSGQPLQSNSTLRRLLNSFTQALRTEVPEGGDFSRGALAGFTLTRSGTIEVNDTIFRTALGANLSGIQALFGSAGIGNAMVLATTAASRAVDGTITSAVSSITDSNTRLTKRLSDLQSRVEERRNALIARFTAMELAISRLQAQGNSLNSSLTGLTAR
ncbi:MAG: flagellar filament capping protein FliD [Gemmatimonadaceae bacterium]|nr:flagellar filament capping protein FliD [Gemmatimonadaceae bacterium]